MVYLFIFLVSGIGYAQDKLSLGNENKVVQQLTTMYSGPEQLKQIDDYIRQAMAAGLPISDHQSFQAIVDLRSKNCQSLPATCLNVTAWSDWACARDFSDKNVFLGILWNGIVKHATTKAQLQKIMSQEAKCERASASKLWSHMAVATRANQLKFYDVRKSALDGINKAIAKFEPTPKFDISRLNQFFRDLQDAVPTDQKSLLGIGDTFGGFILKPLPKGAPDTKFESYRILFNLWHDVGLDKKWLDYTVQAKKADPGVFNTREMHLLMCKAHRVLGQFKECEAFWKDLKETTVFVMAEEVLLNIDQGRLDQARAKLKAIKDGEANGSVKIQPQFKPWIFIREAILENAAENYDAGAAAVKAARAIWPQNLTEIHDVYPEMLELEQLRGLKKYADANKMVATNRKKHDRVLIPPHVSYLEYELVALLLAMDQKNDAAVKVALQRMEKNLVDDPSQNFYRGVVRAVQAQLKKQDPKANLEQAKTAYGPDYPYYKKFTKAFDAYRGLKPSSNET